MAKWQKTNYPGVRFREHPTRKHGLIKKKDQYFSIYYRVDGKRKEEGLGWASAGWNAERANVERSKLKEAHRTGEGPRTLRERRDIAELKRKAAEAKKKEAELNATTFAQYFTKAYYHGTKGAKKETSRKTEKGLFENWIEPALGGIPLVSITASNVEAVRNALLQAEKTPRTVQYAFAVIRQVWNRAQLDGLVQGDSPTKGVKIPKFDNRRVRFLSESEADLVLNELEIHSPQVHSMALLSLYCGLRAGEIYALKWGDVDLKAGTLHLKDTKGGVNRMAYMPDHVIVHVKGMKPGRVNGYMFVSENGNKITSISNTFFRVVDSLGLNADVDDSREKVVFHTLRHTYASWLVQRGVDLYKVKKLLGHGTIAMTERYSHLAGDTLKQAITSLNRR